MNVPAFVLMLMGSLLGLIKMIRVLYLLLAEEVAGSSTPARNFTYTIADGWVSLGDHRLSDKCVVYVCTPEMRGWLTDMTKPAADWRREQLSGQTSLLCGRCDMLKHPHGTSGPCPFCGYAQ